MSAAMTRWLERLANACGWYWWEGIQTYREDNSTRVYLFENTEEYRKAANDAEGGGYGWWKPCNGWRRIKPGRVGRTFAP